MITVNWLGGGGYVLFFHVGLAFLSKMTIKPLNKPTGDSCLWTSFGLLTAQIAKLLRKWGRAFQYFDFQYTYIKWRRGLNASERVKKFTQRQWLRWVRSR